MYYQDEPELWVFFKTAIRTQLTNCNFGEGARWEINLQ